MRGSHATRDYDSLVAEDALTPGCLRTRLQNNVIDTVRIGSVGFRAP